MSERSTTITHVRSPASFADRSAPLLLCFSHLRWDFVWQRPQHLLSRAAQRYHVVVVEEPVFKEGVVAHMDVSTRPGGITLAVPTLPWGLDEAEILLEQRRLLDRLLAREPESPRILWYYTPMALAFSDHVEGDVVVFDKMDELSAFAGASPELLALEAALLDRADVVFTGGQSLYEAARHRHGNLHAFPSSIETEHFVKARKEGQADPADQAAIPHPRLGFFGVIDERMDLDLVRDVALLRPDWHFVMIGPVVKIDEASLPRLPNIHWLGGKAYQALPAYLAGWDVGFMPFARNEATRFISPTKTPEFLAAGRPVVSTPITDVVRPYGERGLVEIAADAAEVVDKVENLLARPRNAELVWLSKVDRHLSAGSWDKTWAAMHKLIGDGLGETPSRATLPTYATTPAE